MALPTVLELVNDVLIRLREPEVTDINDNTISKLVAKFINDSKRQVEDAYNWNALSNTLVTTTSNGTETYTLTGANGRFKILNIFNNNTKEFLKSVSKMQMTVNLLGTSTPMTGSPSEYNINGIDSNGIAKVTFYPVPDSAYPILFNIFDPEDDMVNNTDTMRVPKDPVVHLAYSKAIAERGEDGGIQSSEAYLLYLQVLGDMIAIEQARNPEEECWNPI